MTPPDLRLIVITDPETGPHDNVADVVQAALEAGAPAIQLRHKQATPAELYQETIQIRDLTRRFGATLFVNDRVDVALAAEADGVHLGPADLSVAVARAAATSAGRESDFFIGASTDDPEHAKRLRADGADYIGCGAVFGTTSKAEVGDEQIGTDRLREVVEAVPVPVVGIGGITPANVQSVAATGAAGVAVIRAVMAADVVEEAVRALLDPFPPRTR